MAPVAHLRPVAFKCSTRDHATSVAYGDQAAKMTNDATPKPRRFFKTAEIGAAGADGYPILLDGRPARTPGARPLLAPTAVLAKLIAAEWSAQGDTLDWRRLPATRLAGVVIDGGLEARARAMDVVAGYGASDLICYFAPSPRSLAQRQTQLWGPLLDWSRDAHGLEFVRVTGVMPQPQPAETLSRLTKILTKTDDFTLAGLGLAASVLGSAVLALALSQGRLNAAGAIEAGRLDETFQEEQWGRDGESTRRAEGLAGEIQMLEAWFTALR